jgi:molecular chaperone GrpE
METKRAEEKWENEKPVDADGNSDLPEQEQETTSEPRVVDKRRFVKLLEEGSTTPEPAPEIPQFPSYVEELQSKLKANEERMLEYAERYREARQQMQEEVETIRARLHRTLGEQLEQGKARFIDNLLEVLDNLKRAVQSAEETQNFQSLLAGVRAIVTLFERSLEAEGVVVLDPKNESFDPRFHEAVETVEVDPDRDGFVAEVLQPGYRLGENTLIRPARVRVGRKRTMNDE